MIDLIRDVVLNNPDRIVYKVNDSFITYECLWKQATEYACFLKKEGTSPVVIYGHKKINFVISVIACLLARRAYVPVSKCMPLERVRKIIDLTGSSIVLSDYKLDGFNCVCLSDLVMYNDLEEKVQDNDVAYIIFMSGSTGEPKGVPITRKNLNNFIEWISNLDVLCDFNGVNVLNHASFSFDLSVADFYYSLCNGHTLIGYDGDFNDDKLFDVFKEINVAVLTPTFIKYCLLNENFNEFNYCNLKCIYFCGEMLEVKTVSKLFDRFPNINVINAYGPTEATSAVSAISIKKEMLDKFKILPVGFINNFAVDIIDDEIVLKGDSVFNGYLGDFIGGHYVLDGVNCYKTSDVGYIENGMLFCIGRRDSQVNLRVIGLSLVILSIILVGLVVLRIVLLLSVMMMVLI